MIFVGAKDPEGLEIWVSSPAGGFDLSDVTSVEALDGTVGSLTVEPPNGGARRNWPCDISPGATATLLKLTHVFDADGEDVTGRGDWIVCGFLVTASTRRRMTPAKLTVTVYP